MCASDPLVVEVALVHESLVIDAADIAGDAADIAGTSATENTAIAAYIAVDIVAFSEAIDILAGIDHGPAQNSFPLPTISSSGPRTTSSHMTSCSQL